MRSTYSQDATETEQVVLERFRSVDLLILDDVGAAKVTDLGTRGLAHAIIDGRYLRGLPTLLCTNLTAAELPEAIGDVPSIVYAKAAARTSSFLAPVCGPRSSHRQRASPRSTGRLAGNGCRGRARRRDRTVPVWAEKSEAERCASSAGERFACISRLTPGAVNDGAQLRRNAEDFEKWVDWAMDDRSPIER